MEKLLDKKWTEDMVKSLAAKFKMPVPKVTWCDMPWTVQDDMVLMFRTYAMSGGDKPCLSVIGGAISPKHPEWGIQLRRQKNPNYEGRARKSSVIHEFAHLVAMDRGVVSRSAGNNTAHGRPFYEVLKEVIKASGVPYAWSREYDQIQKWAREEGLL